jgi:hypothetical protein
MKVEELREYRNRWKAVAVIEKEEQRQASLEFRWRQLNRLLAMATALGLKMNLSQGQVNIVRRRWNRLKDLSEDRHGG